MVYRRIAYIAGQLDPRVMQRRLGYELALREAGCYDPALELLDPAPTSMALGARLFARILDRHPDIDALFFCNDDLAQGGLMQALRMGIPVPDRVAVVGFNDLPGSDQMLPPLTTIRTPRERIGTLAATMLLDLIGGRTPARSAVDVGFELIERGSG